MIPTLFTSPQVSRDLAKFGPTHWNNVTGLLTALLGGSEADGLLLAKDAGSATGATWVVPPTVDLSGYVATTDPRLSETRTFQVDPVAKIVFTPTVGANHPGIRLDKLSTDTTHSNFVQFSIDDNLLWGVGMDTANVDFVSVYQAGVGDLFRVNANSRFILGPGIGTPTNDASLEIAGNATSAKQFVLRGILTGGGSDATALLIETMLTPAANQSAGGLMLQPQFTEAGSGTHSRFASLEVRAPNITPGAATLTDAVSCLLFPPSGGVNNYALWVTGGLAKFDGTLTVAGAVTVSSQLLVDKTQNDTVSLANAAASIGAQVGYSVSLLIQQLNSAPYGVVLQNSYADAPIVLQPNAGNVGIAVRDPKSALHLVGAIEGAEMTAPGSPAANGYRLYAEDNGSGKTRLMVLFASGAAQQVAIQP